MKLTQADKALLLDMGHPESDFGQIEEATRKTTYEYDGKQIGRAEAITLLGRRSYLAGIARSAFHCSATQLTPEKKPVYFDSSRLFEVEKGWQMNDSEALTCPYCGGEQYIHEPDDISALMCLTTCEHCDREFWYAVEVTREYSSRRYEEG